jgi:hypothetical protein
VAKNVTIVTFDISGRKLPSEGLVAVTRQVPAVTIVSVVPDTRHPVAVPFVAV